jgi:hypothetical protein
MEVKAMSEPSRDQAGCVLACEPVLERLLTPLPNSFTVYIALWPDCSEA